MPVLPDSSPATRYVQELGRKLQTVIPADRSWPYQFHVVPAADINAFALPGGPIFVNLGTIQAADNEAELAGVLAHEMSHVYMQHSAKAGAQGHRRADRCRTGGRSSGWKRCREPGEDGNPVWRRHHADEIFAQG